MHLLIGRQRLAQAALNEQQVAMHIKRVGKARIQAKRALNQLASPAKTTLNKVRTRGKTESGFDSSPFSAAVAAPIASPLRSNA